MSERLIIRFRGKGAISQHLKNSIAKIHNVKIIDSSTKMLVVEGNLQGVQAFIDETPQLVAFEEVQYSLPDSIVKEIQQ